MEEGHLTKHIFLCLGPEELGDDVWEIGRSYAVLMSQEKWGLRIDSATSEGEIFTAIEEFMDKGLRRSA